MIYWTPQDRAVAATQMRQFMSLVEQNSAKKFSNYETFHHWSVTHFEEFWTLWLKHSGLRYEGSESPAFVSPDQQMLSSKFFPQITLNFAENLLQESAQLPEAIVGMDELGRRRAFSGSELVQQVTSVQRYLKSLGISKGDHVAAVLPNIPETIIAMLATTSLGAVWTSCSPDFGVQGVIDRFAQVSPKMIFLADAYVYGGKFFDLKEKNTAIVQALSSLKSHYTIAYMGRDGQLGSKGFGDIPQAQVTERPEFVQTTFDHPLYIMYSSGTTGVPKCMVHTVGGTLLQHLKELKLHVDLRPRETLFYYTTCGWMMWNWMVSSLAVGARVLTFDGSPMSPDAEVLWRWVEKEQITVFGTSAKFIRSCAVAALQIKEKYELSRLKTVLSTGSPLLPEDFDYFYNHVCREPIQLASISGGTDIISCFVLGNPMLPVSRGEIQCAGLGMNVQVWADKQKPAAVDEAGELVCTTPFPSMPGYFLNDPKNEKYQKAYFEKYPGVWAHGDYILKTKNGSFVIQGRSDTTLNPGGVRIGSSEIYRLVETHPLVADSLAVAQKFQGDERIVLFVKFKEPSVILTEDLRREIASQIRKGATPRHVPAKMIAVADIPYTISGKKVEKAVQMIIHGEKPTNQDALKNPEVLAIFEDLHKNCVELKN